MESWSPGLPGPTGGCLGTSVLMSTVAGLVYIPTSIVEWLPSTCILTSICGHLFPCVLSGNDMKTSLASESCRLSRRLSCSPQDTGSICLLHKDIYPLLQKTGRSKGNLCATSLSCLSGADIKKERRRVRACVQRTLLWLKSKVSGGIVLRSDCVASF